MSRFWPILGTLGDVAGTAEKLALVGFGSQVAPCSCPVGTEVEVLGGRVDVIELKALHRTASDAASAEHLDQLSTPTMLVGLDVGTEVVGTLSGHHLTVTILIPAVDATRQVSREV